ncbi:MAG: hypothetical protein HRU70_06175 [Phycisphaeraceae bacterium]|nr:MAG: hypothetical protein HRU70_06175 [Phycisphaeraceae bacterium]
MKIEGRWLAAGVLIAGGAVMMAMSAYWTNPCSDQQLLNNQTCNTEPCQRCCRICCTHFNGGYPDEQCEAANQCNTLPHLCPPKPSPPGGP